LGPKPRYLRLSQIRKRCDKSQWSARILIAAASIRVSRRPRLIYINAERITLPDDPASAWCEGEPSLTAQSERGNSLRCGPSSGWGTDAINLASGRVVHQRGLPARMRYKSTGGANVSQIPEGEVAELRLAARQSAARQSVAPPPPNHYSPRRSERSAARLAHQSGGLGVPSSNLGAPTNKRLNYQDKPQRFPTEHLSHMGTKRAQNPNIGPESPNAVHRMFTVPADLILNPQRAAEEVCHEEQLRIWAHELILGIEDGGPATFALAHLPIPHMTKCWRGTIRRSKQLSGMSVTEAFCRHRTHHQLITVPQMSICAGKRLALIISFCRRRSESKRQLQTRRYRIFSANSLD
jgi:hypothetical protein